MLHPQKIFAGVFGLMTTLWMSSVQAHEFWLMPEAFQVGAKDQLRVHLRNGEQMNGQSLPYLESQIRRFDMIGPNGTQKVSGRTGDLPAMMADAPAAGLLVIVHETADRTVTYDDFEVFKRFVTHKDASAVLESHQSRGLPTVGFTESYRRYAKTLVAVGNGAGADRPTGLDIEIVALANPYTDDVSKGMPLQVLRKGAPVPDAQVEMFAQSSNGAVTVSVHRTNAQGVAMVPAQSGVSYLADSVEVLPLPNNDASAGPVWHSVWASLTYQVP